MEAVLEDKQKIISQFLAEEKRETEEWKLKRIQESNDLLELSTFYWRSHYGTPIWRALDERVSSIADEILNEEKNCEKLAIWLLGSVSVCDERSLLRIKTLARIKSLCDQIENLSEFLMIHLVINKKFYSISHHDLNKISVFKIFHERMLVLIAAHSEKRSFEFLIKMWKQFGEEFNTRLQMKPLFADAISSETDLQKLATCESKASGEWTIIEIVQSRIAEVILEILPKTDDLEILENYLRIATSHSNKQVQDPVGKRIALIVAKRLEKMQDENQISKFRSSLGYHSRRSEYVKGSFNIRMEQLIPEILSGLLTADLVYPYFQLDSYKLDLSTIRLVQTRFDELLPEYFKKNPNLRQAVQWYHCPGIISKKKLGEIIESLANKETDIGLLAELLEDEQLAPSREILSYRFFELMAGLSEPTDFFITCIEQKTFYGNKEFFYDKARQFAAIV